MRFPIRYRSPWSWFLPLLLLPARLAYIRIDGDTVKVRMSWAFRSKFPRRDVVDVTKHRPVVSVGAHGWKGRWVVNGANRPIATIQLSQPTQARVLGFPVTLQELLVSVDDRDALRRSLVS